MSIEVGVVNFHISTYGLHAYVGSSRVEGGLLCWWGYVRHRMQRWCRLVTGELLPWFMSAQWHRWTDKEYPHPSLPYYISLLVLAQKGPPFWSVMLQLGIWRYFTGMNMLSANNTLSGWAETQYSALFTPPHHKLHSCERMKVCTQAQGDKKNNPPCCLSTPTKITMWAVHKKNIHIF